MLKDTKEFNTLLGSGTNAGYSVMEDGKVNINDFPRIIDPLLKGEAGVMGVGNILPELAEASIEDKEDALGAFAEQLGTSVPEDDAADLTAFVGGIQAAISYAGRKTRRETLEQVAAALNGGALALSGNVTADDLEAIIAGK